MSLKCVYCHADSIRERARCIVCNGHAYFYEDLHPRVTENENMDVVNECLNSIEHPDRIPYLIAVSSAVLFVDSCRRRGFFYGNQDRYTLFHLTPGFLLNIPAVNRIFAAEFEDRHLFVETNDSAYNQHFHVDNTAPYRIGVAPEEFEFLCIGDDELYIMGAADPDYEHLRLLQYLPEPVPPPPVTRAYLRALPTIEGPYLEECTICMEAFSSENPSFTRLPPCGHTFHTSCITDWLLKTNTCPMCRYGHFPTISDVYNQWRATTI